MKKRLLWLIVLIIVSITFTLGFKEMFEASVEKAETARVAVANLDQTVANYFADLDLGEED